AFQEIARSSGKLKDILPLIRSIPTSESTWNTNGAPGGFHQTTKARKIAACFIWFLVLIKTRKRCNAKSRRATPETWNLMEEAYRQPLKLYKCHFQCTPKTTTGLPTI